jgi:hypothetical protein
VATPERRRRRQELKAEAEMYRAQAKAICAELDKRREERLEAQHASASRSLFRRLFGGRRAA